MDARKSQIESSAAPPAPSAQSDQESVALTPRQLFGLSFFSLVKDQTLLDGHCEGIRLRRVRKGETICRQGEPGWTAMCLLGALDLQKLKEPVLELARQRSNESETRGPWRKPSRENSSSGSSSEPESELGIAVYLAHPRKAATGRREGLLSWLFGDKKEGGTADPSILPVDALPHLEYEIRKARIFEGELFGELNCKRGEPRSATLVAEKDCHVVEIPGTLMELLESDPGFREQIDKIYLKRGFEHELLSLSIFEDLDPGQIEHVRSGVELVRCSPHEVIFQENDLPDAIYIIRRGMVQTVKGFTDLVGLADIADWKALFAQLEILRDPAAPASWSAVAARIDWSAPEPLDAFQDQAPEADAMTLGEKQEWIHKLNDFLKNPFVGDKARILPDPPASKTIQELWPQPVTGKKEPPRSAQEIAAAVAAWTPRERSCFGRNWLEAVLGPVIPPRHGGADRVQVLSYMSRGEYFGEMGVLADQPRSATCIAFAPPNTGTAASSKTREPVIELVKVPGDLFLEILADAPALRRKVDQKVAKRNQNDRALLGGQESVARAAD